MSRQVPRALPAVMRKAPKGVTETTSREWTSAVTMSLTLAQQLAIQQLLFGASEPSHTLSEAIERYRAEHLHTAQLAPNTLLWRERACEYLARYGGREVEGRFHDVACAIYAKKGDATGSHIVNTLGRILRLARRWGWRNQGHDLEGLCRIRSRQRTETLTPADCRRLLAYLSDESRPRAAVAADVCRLILWTGMRVGEACGIEWSHVSDDAVTLPKTKGRRVRLVPLCAQARSIIHAQPKTHRWVFLARDGLGPINRTQPTQVMREACAELGFTSITPHSLRHTWATEAMRAGVADQVAARVLGHASTRELQRYQHARVEDSRQAILAFAQKIGGKR